MKIPPSTIIMLNDNNPYIRPQLGSIAITEAYKNGAFHTRINDNDYYMAFTENTKSLFYDDEFLGGMITIRKKGENRNSPNLEHYTFFMHADAVAIDTKPDSVLLSPVGGNWPILFHNHEDINVIRRQYRLIYTQQYEQNPTEFEMNWGKFLANKPDFHYYAGRFTF